MVSPVSANQMLPSEPMAMPCGPAFEGSVAGFVADARSEIHLRGRR
jgi:hypothetical protein